MTPAVPLERRADVPLACGPAWPGVRIYCTTRLGPDGDDNFNLALHTGDDPAAVLGRRGQLLAALPAEPGWLSQVHGVAVHDADGPAPAEMSTPQADAALTAEPGRVLAILTADCLPVVLADAQARVLAVVHAGWRGLAAGVLERTVDALRLRAPGARDWRAWIGPGIGPRHYEVGADVRDACMAGQPDAAACFRRVPDADRWLADLPALAKNRLMQVGVEEVTLSGWCTASQDALWYSYRRERTIGRFATLAWLDAQPR